MAGFAVKTSSNKGGLELMAWGTAEDVSERPQETQGAVKAQHPGSSAKQSPVAVWVRSGDGAQGTARGSHVPS